MRRWRGIMGVVPTGFGIPFKVGRRLQKVTDLKYKTLHFEIQNFTLLQFFYQNLVSVNLVIRLKTGSFGWVLGVWGICHGQVDTSVRFSHFTRRRRA